MKNIVSILIAILLMSCSRPENYDFIVYNDTYFLLNSFEIGSSSERVTISVNPNERSDEVTFEFGGTFFNFTTPLLSLGVREYSDSTGIYETLIGSVTSIPDLNEDCVNIIVVRLNDNNQDQDIVFDMEVNPKDEPFFNEIIYK